jgi:pimeloyl-ACP methyl ester carboxylesterase
MPSVSTNGVETYYERAGSGPPIVFVHGAILDHSQWDEQVDALSEAYTTVAYDVRGHGRSGGSARGRYSMELFADDLAALLEELDLERPVLVGHSTGGCIAQVYAARNPESIAGLVLSSTFGPPHLTRGEWLQRSVLLRATIAPVRLVGYERVEKAMVWLTERFQRGAGGDYEKVQRLREAGPTMTTAEFAKVIRAVAAFHRSGVDLAAITTPTLVLYGEHEPPFVRRHARRFQTAIPEVTVREVPGAGHASNLDAPRWYDDALRSFLESLSLDGGPIREGAISSVDGDVNGSAE